MQDLVHCARHLLSPKTYIMCSFLCPSPLLCVQISNECKVEVDEEEFVESFRPSLMDVIFRWSKGADFAEVRRVWVE